MKTLSCLLLACFAFASLAPGATLVVREESAAPIVLGEVTLSATTLVRDALAGDIEGRLFARSRGSRHLVHARKGYSLTTLEKADFGAGPMVVLGWTSAGKGQYLIPEVHRFVSSPAGPRLVKVWGPHDANPLYQGDLTVETAGGRAKLVLVDHLTGHSFVPPLLTKTVEVAWRAGAFMAGPPAFETPTTLHQKANLGHELEARGQLRESLRLYLDAVREGERSVFRQDPELAASLYVAVAQNYEKLGDRQGQREHLMKVADGYPDTAQARDAADRLLRMKAGELRGR